MQKVAIAGIIKQPKTESIKKESPKRKDPKCEKQKLKSQSMKEKAGINKKWDKNGIPKIIEKRRKEVK